MICMKRILTAPSVIFINFFEIQEPLSVRKYLLGDSSVPKLTNYSKNVLKKKTNFPNTALFVHCAAKMNLKVIYY